MEINTGPETAPRQGLSEGTTLHVYAEAGDTVQLGSSAVGVGDGNILVWPPGADPSTDAPVFDCVLEGGGDGVIASREQEIAGPEEAPDADPNTWAPCEFEPTAAGIYTVRMMAPDSAGTNYGANTVEEPIQQTESPIVAIWDITVRDGGGNVQQGRTFSYAYAFSERGTGGSGVEMYVYTKTGHEYRVDLTNQDGVQWSLWADDLGVVDATTGERLFASFACQDPGGPTNECKYFDATSGPVERRYPVFVNRTDAAVITGPGGLATTEGYSATPIAPSTNPLRDAAFSGSAGQSAATAYGEGGTFAFTSPPAMAGLGYTLAIDVDRNGTFGDGADFVDQSNELTDSGSNSLSWDGRDATGALLPCGDYQYSVRSALAEVHFPMIDVENSGGTTIERLTLPTEPTLGDPFAASYNDIDPYKQVDTTNATPDVVTDGDSSQAGFHAWTLQTGDTDYIDTWARSPEVETTGTLRVLCADLGIAKSAPGTVDAGGQVTWTMTITNHGPDPSTGSTVTDSIPTGITGASTSTPGCSVAGGNVTCAIGALAVGASSQVQVTGKAPSTKTCFTNTASVAGEPHDPNATNNSASSRTCTLVANVSIDKTSSKQRVKVGDPLVYTLTVRNNGPDAANNPRVTDTAPDNLDVRRVSSSKGACNANGNDVVCTMGPMAVGETAKIRVRAIAIEAGGSKNTAEVTDTRCVEEPCDTDPARVGIVKPRLQLRKTVKPKRLRAGQKAVYNIVVRNPSRAPMRRVRVCDNLPRGMVFVRSKPRMRLVKGRYCRTFKRLGARKAKRIRVVVRALRGTSGRKVNRVVATSPDAKRARDKAPLRVIGGQVRAGGVTG